MTNKPTATKLEEIPNTTDRFQTALYKLSEPLEGHTYIIVSAMRYPGKPDTLIFPSTRGGTIADFETLLGSTDGTADHATALKAAGYQITEDPS